MQGGTRSNGGNDKNSKHGQNVRRVDDVGRKRAGERGACACVSVWTGGGDSEATKHTKHARWWCVVGLPAAHARIKLP